MKKIYSRTARSYKTIGSIEDKLMKRSIASAKTLQQQNFIAGKNKDEEETSTKIQTAPVVLDVKPKLNLKSLRSQDSNNIPSTSDSSTSSKKSKILHKESNIEASHIEKKEEEFKPTSSPAKGKRRAVVDLQMMKEELSQLEDPPITPWEKELSSNRLRHEFFNIPCEELAQKLLGKILVRYFENGIVLKGRIVETEGYLGTIDKASHSYQNKVTSRNLPMFMAPGTIYVYMTYGMYHCFNISSQEKNAYVLIKAMEPLMGLEYMEMLRNMRCNNDGREKQIVRRAVHLKQYDLCNSPSKICHTFAISQDTFDQKLAYACDNLWFEKQPFVRSPTIVSVSSENHDLDDNGVKKTRYYVLGSASIDERNIECEKHAYIVTN